MKKHFFNVIAALALVCGVFAFSGCTDYEEDINAINDRLDNLETGQLASLEEQIEAISGALEDANGLIDVLQGNVGDLQDMDEGLQKQIDAINGEIETVKGEITDLGNQISSLEDDLNRRIDSVVDELKEADTTNAKRISDLADQLEAAQAELEKLISDGDAANLAKINELSERIDNLYDELIKAIKDGDQANAEEIGAVADDLKALRDEFDTKVEELADLVSAVAQLKSDLENLQELTSGLPALEELVNEIAESYLSIDEASKTYATIKMLEDSIGKVNGRLDLLESLNIGERLGKIEDVLIPGLQTQIDDVRATASEAKRIAETALSKAEDALGQIEVLQEALGSYATSGELEAHMEYLLNMVETLSKKDLELEGLIKDLESSVALKILDVQNSIDSLDDKLDKAIEDIKNTMATKEELDARIQEVMNMIDETADKISEEMLREINEATQNLQNQINTINGQIEDINEALDSLNKRVTEIEGWKDDIQDLENRIQSLVFVPEYNDGKATVLSYTINSVPVSDSMVVTATFQVTPAALAENVINQYDNVFVNVIPVLTRSASDAAFIASAQDRTLRLSKGKGAGYIDMEVTVPVTTEDDIELTPGAFAISFYVASKEEVEAIINDDMAIADMDAGTYIASDYVQTAGKATAIDDTYVLYNEVVGKEYPSMDEVADEVNSYERAWSVLNREVSFYGDNNYDEKDDGTYTLHIKLDDEYYTLEEAAAMFRANVADITPDYSYIIQYYDRLDNAVSSIAEYFDVTEEEPYGLKIDMAKASEMTDIIGSYVFAKNMFTFGEDSRYGGGLTVVENTGKYKVINLPININIDAARIDWTYDFALAHANDSENPAVPNIQPIDSTLSYMAENLGEISLADILTLEPKLTEVRLGDSETPMAAQDAPVIAFSNVNKLDDTTGSIDISVIKYDFSAETENVYHFTNTYDLEDYMVNCTVNFTLTLGQMPGDIFVNYEQLPRDIKFMLPGSGDFDTIGIDNGYTKAFKILNTQNPTWFTDEAQLTSSMQVNDMTRFTTYRDGEILNGYESVENTSQNPVYTRLSVEPDAEYPSGSYVRVSSSQITAVGNVFDFITEINTWYGVTYTYTNSGKVSGPEFALDYIHTHVYGYDGPNPYVQLDYHLNGNGVYVIDEANLKNYFEVTGLPEGFEGELTVRFETLTQENPAEGYKNVPSIPVLNVNNETGSLGEYTIDWTQYTARDLNIRATLVASANETTTEEIELNSLDLTVQVYPLVESASMKTSEDLDYYGNNYVMDGDYIILNREANETVTIRLWEYVNAFARFSDGKNFVPYENANGDRHENLIYVNQNRAMTIYGATLVFDDNYDAISGDQRRLLDYDAAAGTVIYHAEDGEIANPIYITVEGDMLYYLDYNHVEAYPVTIKIKLQDM